MSVLSLFSVNNSVEEGFELAGYDIAVNCNNAIGIIGPINRKLTNAVKSLRPLFFVGVSDHDRKVDIDGYITTTHISTDTEYQCSRNITWIVGIMDNTVHNKFLHFQPLTIIHLTIYTLILPLLLLLLAI